MTAIRQSVSVKDVAAILACAEQTVRNLVTGGELEGHRVGRAIRVYADSIEALRKRRAIQPERQQVNVPQKVRTRVASKACRDALAEAIKSGTFRPM